MAGLWEYWKPKDDPDGAVPRRPGHGRGADHGGGRPAAAGPRPDAAGAARRGLDTWLNPDVDAKDDAVAGAARAAVGGARGEPGAAAGVAAGQQRAQQRARPAPPRRRRRAAAARPPAREPASGVRDQRGRRHSARPRRGPHPARARPASPCTRPPRPGPCSCSATARRWHRRARPHRRLPGGRSRSTCRWCSSSSPTAWQGRRAPAAAAQLDTAWLAVVELSRRGGRAAPCHAVGLLDERRSTSSATAAGRRSAATACTMAEQEHGRGLGGRVHGDGGPVRGGDLDGHGARRGWGPATGGRAHASRSSCSGAAWSSRRTGRGRCCARSSGDTGRGSRLATRSADGGASAATASSLASTSGLSHVSQASAGGAGRGGPCRGSAGAGRPRPWITAAVTRPSGYSPSGRRRPWASRTPTARPSRATGRRRSGWWSSPRCHSYCRWDEAASGGERTTERGLLRRGTSGPGVDHPGATPRGRRDDPRRTTRKLRSTVSGWGCPQRRGMPLDDGDDAFRRSNVVVRLHPLPSRGTRRRGQRELIQA